MNKPPVTIPSPHDLDTPETQTQVEPANILVIDDQELNLRVMSSLIRSLGHRPFTADSGLRGLQCLNEIAVDLVLLDISMPILNGVEVLEILKQNEKTRDIRVVVVSGMSETETVARCIKLGADDYLLRPLNSTILAARIDACLLQKRLEERKRRYRQELEIRLQEKLEEVFIAQSATIYALSKLAESRDPDTGEHLERIREYARLLALQLGHRSRYAWMDELFVHNIYAGAPLHDIGKVGVPDRILLKPERLTAEEYEMMTFHTTIGAETLRAVHLQHPSNAFIRFGIEIAESHHERWDGHGYPHGLAGEKIPLVGRLIAVADVYDALTSKRCYKNPLDHATSCDIIINGKGTQFDPDIVDAFLAAHEEFTRIHERYQDSEKTMLH